ncbi:hypothetical protein CPB84DRAFT_1628449, partial [Gymnopilus junonius]
MRPNTPHAVVTLEHSVTLGSHYFAMSTMQDTWAGLLHTFVLEKLITNTAHNAFLHVIRQMIIFVHNGLTKDTIEEEDKARAHLPHLQDMQSVTDLLTLCNLGILQHVFDFDTYTHATNSPTDVMTPKQKDELWKYDFNAVPPLHRRAAMHARALALDIIGWFNATYELRGKVNGENITVRPISIAAQFLGVQCSGLLYYKNVALEKGHEGVANCTLEMLRRQI